MVFPRVNLSLKGRIRLASLSGTLHELFALVLLAISFAELVLGRLHVRWRVSAVQWRVTSFVGWTPIVASFLFAILSLLNLGAGIIARLRTAAPPKRIASQMRAVIIVQLMVIVFLQLLLIFYATQFDANLSTGILQTMIEYTNSSESRLVLNRLQSSLDCCGVNGLDDYSDFGVMDMHGADRWIQSPAPYVECTGEQKSCWIPVTCITPFSIMGTPEYDRLDMSGSNRTYTRWLLYRTESCLEHARGALWGLADPWISVWATCGVAVVQLLISIASRLWTTADALGDGLTVPIVPGYVIGKKICGPSTAELREILEDQQAEQDLDDDDEEEEADADEKECNDDANAEQGDGRT